MQKNAYFQLSGLTFFQFVVLGAYSPIIGSYLKDTLRFSGAEVGLVLTVFQFASMVAPLAAAVLVDRVIPARSLFFGLHLIGVVLGVSLVHVKEFLPFLGLFGIYAFFMGPTTGLVSALTFARMPDGRKHYGTVRLWGTVGWITSAFVLALVWMLPASSMDWMFYLSSLGSLISAGFSLLLPRVPVDKSQEKFQIVPKAAFRVFARPAILKFGVVYFVSGILDRFYFIATAPYLKQLGFTDSQIMPAMTLGQITEVFLLLLTGPMLKRFGLRKTLLVGQSAQLVRFTLMMTNPGPLWLIGALSLNGFIFAFFYAVSTIFVNGHATPDTQGGVNQLLNLIFAGTSSVVGSMLAGLAFDWFGSGDRVDYSHFWIVPIVLSVLTIGMVWTFFSSKEKAAEITSI